MKKVLSITLCALLLLAMFAACRSSESPSSNPPSASPSGSANPSSAAPSDEGSDVPDYLNAAGLPIVKEPVSIRVMGLKDGGGTEWSELELFKRAEEATGIHFEFELYDDITVYTDKMNLAITIGDYPDLFLRNMGGMTPQAEESNGREGTFIDLTDLIDGYMPNLKALMEDNAYLKAAMTTTDGHIFSFPYYYQTATGNPHQMFMFDGWLKEAGFTDVPSTIDEFYNLLVALDALDINGNGNLDDDIPLGAWDKNLFEKFLIPAFTGQIGMSFGLDAATGQVVHTPSLPAYKEFLLFANKLYTEGLLDQEVYTQNVDQWLAKLKENRIGIFNASPTATDPEKAYGTAISLKPLTSATNPTPVCEQMPFLITGAAVITDKCEYPEALARWIDLFYSMDDESMEGLNGRTLFAGWRGEHWDFTDDTQESYSYIAPIATAADINATVSVNMWMPGYLSLLSVPVGSPLYEQKVAGVIKNQVPYMTPGLPAGHMRLTTEEADVRIRVLSEADEYAKQMTAQFIVGAQDIESGFDAFVKNFETMGVPDMIEAYQNAYDRFASNMK